VVLVFYPCVIEAPESMPQLIKRMLNHWLTCHETGTHPALSCLVSKPVFLGVPLIDSWLGKEGSRRQALCARHV